MASPRELTRSIVGWGSPTRIEGPLVLDLVMLVLFVVARGTSARDPDANGLLGAWLVGAALLAESVEVDLLVIATDVPHAILDFGTPDARPIGEVTLDEMRAYAAAGHFAGGSMGPKVDAICRFVERSGRRGVITDLTSIVAAASGRAGTVVVPNH